MNALFLKDLAAKTHRGLRGRVEDGKSGGGLCYGYRVVRQFDAKGEQIRGIIEAIMEGMFHPSMKAEMDTLEARKAELASLLSDIPDDVPDLLPSASAVYARKVGRLTDALNRPEERLEAAEALRALIEKVVLTPGPNRGEIDAMLYGELGTILT